MRSIFGFASAAAAADLDIAISLRARRKGPPLCRRRRQLDGLYSEDASSSLATAIGATDVSLDDSFGSAVQAGVDFDITERIFLNLDVKYIDIDTTATLDTSGVINTVDVKLDPVVAGIGIGMRF